MKRIPFLLAVLILGCATLLLETSAIRTAFRAALGARANQVHAVFCSQARLTGATTAPSMQVGINIGPINYWTRSLRNNLASAMYGNNGPWDGATCSATTGLPVSGTGTAYFYPNILVEWPGPFVVTWQGAGTLTCGSVAIPAGTPTTLTAAQINAAQSFKFAAAAGGAGMTGITIFQQGVTADGWSANFLQQIQPLSGPLRLMQVLNTNSPSSGALTWANRVPPGAVQWSQAGGGPPWEAIADLANKTGKDIWIDVPVNANAAYVTSLAQLLAADITGANNVYVEYANETWNGGLPCYAIVAGYAASNATITAAANAGTINGAAGYTVLETSAIRTAFRAAFGARANQVHAVFCSQAANSWLASSALAWAKTQGYTVDAIACAPYFSDNGEAAGTATATILADYQANLPGTIGWMTAWQAVAKQYGLPLYMYEGGTSSYPSNDANRLAAQFAPGLLPIMQQWVAGLQTNGFTIIEPYDDSLGDTFSYRKTWNDVTSPKIASVLAVAGTVTPPAAVAPVVTTQPVSQTVAAGASVTFTAAASGTPTPTCQWYCGGTAITGATTPTLTLTATASATYSATFTNSAGSATTNAATLTVQAAPPPAPSDPVVNVSSQTTVTVTHQSGKTTTFTANGATTQP